MVKAKRKIPGDGEISCSSLFLDSGAFSMRQRASKFASETGKHWSEFYHTDEFRGYCDAYAEFVLKYRDGIDVYANVDVLPDLSDNASVSQAANLAAEMTWENQQYLERAGIKPMPVVHLGTDMKWVWHYIDRGYDYIGLGGMIAAGGYGVNRSVKGWLDRVFGEVVCNTENRLPCVKTHGFGLMGPMIFRYPFYSVDSTSWVMKGSFGHITYPRYVGGNYRYDLPALDVAVTDPSLLAKEEEGRERVDLGLSVTSGRVVGSTPFRSLSRAERKMVLDWLEHIGVPFGAIKAGKIVVEGVSNTRALRILACLKYYEELLKHVPEYPQPFRVRRRSLGII